MAGQDFSEWNISGSNDASLENLFKKLKEFTNQPLSYWLQQRTGAGSLTKLEIMQLDFYH